MADNNYGWKLPAVGSSRNLEVFTLRERNTPIWMIPGTEEWNVNDSIQWMMMGFVSRLHLSDKPLFYVA